VLGGKTCIGDQARQLVPRDAKGKEDQGGNRAMGQDNNKVMMKYTSEIAHANIMSNGLSELPMDEHASRK
jgi:hypothetical protein